MPDSYIWNPSVECAGREALRRLQLQRLREQVRRLYESAPYYRRKMEEAGVTPEDVRSLEDVAKLPFTTKEDLRLSQPFGALLVPMSEVVEVHGTSGTTGEPLFVYYTYRDIENWSEIMARCLAAAGLTRRDVLQITPSFSLFTGGFGFFYGARKVGATVVPTGPGFSRRQIYVMVKLGVTMLAGIANYALRLAEVAVEMGVDPARDTRVRKGIFGAETWSDSLRRKIERVWDMESFDIYGMAELYGPGVAIDCQHHEGLHVWEDHYLVEVVDPKTGEPVGPEERGELVVTTLTKDAMPLIRYRTGDVTFIIDQRGCGCGRTHLKIGRIIGRTDDMITVSGVNVWPSAIEAVLFKFPLVGNEYLVTLFKGCGRERLLIKVEARTKLSESDREAMAKGLQHELREALAVTPEVEVVDPGSLPRGEGKARRLVVVNEECTEP